MADHHCRVIQERPANLGGTTELATGVKADGDDVVHLHLNYPTPRDADMPITQLEQVVADINTNSGWTTSLTWDD